MSRKKEAHVPRSDGVTVGDFLRQQLKPIVRRIMKEPPPLHIFPNILEDIDALCSYVNDKFDGLKLAFETLSYHFLKLNDTVLHLQNERDVLRAKLEEMKKKNENLAAELDEKSRQLRDMEHFGLTQFFNVQLH